MTTPAAGTVGYGSLHTLSVVHRPTRRRKVLATAIAVATILLCAAFVSLGSSRILGTRLSEIFTTMSVSEPSDHHAVDENKISNIVENWGNQTPTAMIFAKHRPILDGKLDLYLNFPVTGSKFVPPKWFMRIPVRRNSLHSLKQVETAFLDGQLVFPSAKSPSSATRKLLFAAALKKGLKKGLKGAKSTVKSAAKSLQKSLGKNSKASSGIASKSAKKSDSKSGSSSQYISKSDCCLPQCAKGTGMQFKSCSGCKRGTADHAHCMDVISKKRMDCLKLAGHCQGKKCIGYIKSNSIVPNLFDPAVCSSPSTFVSQTKTSSASKSGSKSKKKTLLPVPSCAIGNPGKWGGCKVCGDSKKYPPSDLLICKDIEKKKKPNVGQTAVKRDDKLKVPSTHSKSTPSKPALASAQCSASKKSSCTTCKSQSTSPQIASNDYYMCVQCRDHQKCTGNQSSKSSNPSPSPSPSRKGVKMCSPKGDIKLKGNGLGCHTCQGKTAVAPSTDRPGNDYWACNQCRLKGVCDFKCELTGQKKDIWACTESSASSSSSSPLTRPTPQCAADPKLQWAKENSNEFKCQAHMCKRAGLQPSGDYGPLKYPQPNAFPKSLDAKTCCPFVAQGLNPDACYQKFGCEVPSKMDYKKSLDVADQVKSCKDFFCLLGVTSPTDWASKKGDSVFANGKNKGRSACCEKLLASVPDGKDNWCPNGPPPMDPEACQEFLCQQTPMISDLEASYQLWRQQHASTSRRLLDASSSSSKKKSNGKKSNGKKSNGKSGKVKRGGKSGSQSGIETAGSSQVAACIRTLELAQITSWETNSHCVKKEDEIIEAEDRAGGEPAPAGGEGGGGEAGEASPGGEGEAPNESGGGGPVEEITPEEIPEVECGGEEGPESLPLLPGSNVLGHTYDPEFGLPGCSFDRCVMRSFVKFTFNDCKVVETPAGMFKVPDQIHAHNLYETSAITHIYENEKERQESEQHDTSISGSYGMFSGSAKTSVGMSSSSSSKQHIAVRKIDVHLYRLTLINTRSFSSLHPQFVTAFKALAPRFEDDVQQYFRFVRDWGRYVATSGTFGGTVEIVMKFYSASSASKKDLSVAVEASVDALVCSVSASHETSMSSEQKEVENNNQISLASSGGDPAIGAIISDINSAHGNEFRGDLQAWLESLPKFPRLVEDFPRLDVMTAFIPDSPDEEGFDPFTRNQGILHTMRILHNQNVRQMYDHRQCRPPLTPYQFRSGAITSQPPAPMCRPESARTCCHPEPGATQARCEERGCCWSPSNEKQWYDTPSSYGGNYRSIPWCFFKSEEAKPPAPTACRIFEHIGRKGRSLRLAVGDYDEPYLRSNNFVDTISSLEISCGIDVILYSQPGFHGQSLLLTCKNFGYDLRTRQFNDKTKSLRVIDTAKQKTKKPVSSYVARKLASRLSVNELDRFNLGQCLSFVASTSGSIDAVFVSSPMDQSDAYSFRVRTNAVVLEKGLGDNAVVLKESTDPNAVAFGQSSPPQNVWFCVFSDAEDSSATVFQYGRGSNTLFEHVEKSPVILNYFVLQCSQAAVYRNIVILKAERWLESVHPYNRLCAIVNCDKVQQTQSEDGSCSCEKCALGYEPSDNNQRCVLSGQCPAQFGCLSATPPQCFCEECCCGLSFDPVSTNCVNANMMIRPGTKVQDHVTEIMMDSTSNSAEKTAVVQNQFKVGGSYRLKSLRFSCTETNLQNIRVSYDTSKPSLGFIDYDSTHLVIKGDTAGKFDFSIYDNLRKQVDANPIFSKAGFLNLDEVKLEEVTLASMAKKAGQGMQNVFKTLVEGGKELFKQVEANAKDAHEKLQQAGKFLKEKAEEVAKVADQEIRKFVKTANKVYADVAATAQKVAGAVVNFVADNADLLKVLTNVGGGVASGLVTLLPQLMNLIPGCQAWCGIVASTVGNAAVAVGTAAANGAIDLASASKKSGKNPLAFLTDQEALASLPADIQKHAGPLIKKTISSFNIDDMKKFAESGAQGKMVDSVLKDGFTSIKSVFEDPGLKGVLGAVTGGKGGDLLSQGAGLLGAITGGQGGGDLLSQGANLVGALTGGKGGGDVLGAGLKMVSPHLDKLLPGAGSILGSAGGLLGGLFGGKKRALLSSRPLDKVVSGRRLLIFDWIKKGMDHAGNAINNGLKAVKDVVNKAGDAVVKTVHGAVDVVGKAGAHIANGMDKALGTDMFSKAHGAVHGFVGGAIKDGTSMIVGAATSFVNHHIDAITNHLDNIFDPNKKQREYMNSEEYKDKMRAKALFKTFVDKLELPGNMPKQLTDSIVQWIIGEMKVDPVDKQPFEVNLKAPHQCANPNSAEKCTEGDIQCVVLANKCFLDDERCIRAALESLPTIALEKYAASNNLMFEHSTYGRYIRISAPLCPKRANPTGSRRLFQSHEEQDSSDSAPEPDQDAGDSDDSETEPAPDGGESFLDPDAAFAQQPPLQFGLTAKFWNQPGLVNPVFGKKRSLLNVRNGAKPSKSNGPSSGRRRQLMFFHNFFANVAQHIQKVTQPQVGNIASFANILAKAPPAIDPGQIASTIRRTVFPNAQPACTTTVPSLNYPQLTSTNPALGKRSLLNARGGAKLSKLNDPSGGRRRKLMFAHLIHAIQQSVAKAHPGAPSPSNFPGQQASNLPVNQAAPPVCKATGFAGSSFQTDFLAQFSGNLFVPNTGPWTFYLTSDDGSRLYIDGDNIVDNDGYHGMQEKEGTVILSRGMHTIEVSFFQGGGGAGLTLAWSSAERQKEIIPKEMFLLNSNDVPLSLPKTNGCDLNKNLQVSQIAVYDPFGDNVAVNAACDSSNAYMVTDRLIPYLPAGPGNALTPSSACSLAVDGTLANRDGKGVYQSLHADSDTVTYDLGSDVLIKRIVYYNRKDCCQSMISGATIEVLNANGDVISTQVLNDKLIQTFNFPSSQNTVVLFTRPSYGGEQLALGPGNFKLDEIQVPSSKFASVKVRGNLQVKFFESPDFGGRSTSWLENDVPDLRDQPSGSVMVRERPKDAKNDNQVIAYTQCDYQGDKVVLIPGNYLESQIALPRNSIMSLQVGANVEIQLFSSDNFGGRSSGYLRKNFECLNVNPPDFSRTAVSLQIRKRVQSRKLLSDEERRSELIASIVPHAAQYAFYKPVNGNSQDAKQVMRLAVEVAHHGAHAIVQSHQQHREMLESLAKWVPHQYYLSSLKMDIEKHTATSPIAYMAIDRVHKLLFTKLTEIADTAAEASLNLLDQSVVNMLSAAYTPHTLPAPCFSRELLMSYLPQHLKNAVDTWIEMDKFSWIQEIRVDSVDELLRSATANQVDKYSLSGLTFKFSKYYESSEENNKEWNLIRAIEHRYQKEPAFGGKGDKVSIVLGKTRPTAEDPNLINDCTPIDFSEGEFLISMGVVVIPEGVGGVSSVVTNKRSIPVNCGEKPSTSSELTTDDGVVWITCDVGFDVVGISGKFDTRVMRTMEFQCSPTSQADRVQFLGVYSYSFVTNDFFNGVSGGRGSGYRAGFWAAGPEIGITRQKDKDYSQGWSMRLWTNRVPEPTKVCRVKNRNGCFADFIDSQRCFPVGPVAVDSMEECAKYCSSLDETYKFQAVEMGSECFCGNSISSGRRLMFLPVIAAGIPLLAAGAAAAVGGAALLGGAIAGGVALHKHFSTPPPPPPSMKSCDQLPAEKCKKKCKSGEDCGGPNAMLVFESECGTMPDRSPVTGLPPIGVKQTSLSPADYTDRVNAYKLLPKNDKLVKAMAPPGDAKWMFDTKQNEFTDIYEVTFVENTGPEGGILGVYVHYSARPDLYSGFVLNSEASYKQIRMKNLKLQRNEYWTGLKVGVDPETGAVACITGLKTSVREYGVLCGDRKPECLKKAGWIDCPANAPMMVALQEDFNALYRLVGLMPICASMKASRFEVNEFNIQMEEDEFVNAVRLRQGNWVSAVTQIDTNRKSIPLQCGNLGRQWNTFTSQIRMRDVHPVFDHIDAISDRAFGRHVGVKRAWQNFGNLVVGSRNTGFEEEGQQMLSLSTQFAVANQVKKGQGAIGFRVEVVDNDQFGVFADSSALSALTALENSQPNPKPKTEDELLKMQKMQQTSKGPGPAIVRFGMQALTYDSDPVAAFIMEAPEEAGRARIPEFEDTGVYMPPTFDMAFDFFKPRLGKFLQILSVDFQCSREKSTSKSFWMPWLQVSFTNGESFSQGEKSNDRLAVSKSLPLHAEEFMIKIMLSSHQDKGYAITAIKTNKKYYDFRCGATAISLDTPSSSRDEKMHLFVGFAGNAQQHADGTYFSNLQALYLKLNEFHATQ